MVNGLGGMHSRMAGRSAGLYERQDLPARSSAPLSADVSADAPGEGAARVSISPEARALLHGAAPDRRNPPAAAPAGATAHRAPPDEAGVTGAAGAGASGAAERLAYRRDGLDAATDPHRLVERGESPDFEAWMAAEREIDRRVDERIAIYEKGRAEGADDKEIMRRIAAYERSLAGSAPRPAVPAKEGAALRAEAPGERRDDAQARLAAAFDGRAESSFPGVFA